jgi:hypothetical protein
MKATQGAAARATRGNQADCNETEKAKNEENMEKIMETGTRRTRIEEQRQ